MQLLGEGRQDRIVSTFTATIDGGDYQLHKTASGNFQFGVGKDAKILTVLDEAAMFGPEVQAQVAQWLEGQGPQKAMQEKISADIHEASMTRPGDVDSRLELLEQASPGIKGEILSLIDGILEKKGLVSSPTGSGRGQAGGVMREATSAEIDQMLKSGMKFDPAHPPKVFDPAGALAGSARTLNDSPDVTLDSAEGRHPNPMDILRREQEDALSGSDDALGLSDELADEDEGEFAGVAAASAPPSARTTGKTAKRKK